MKKHQIPPPLQRAAVQGLARHKGRWPDIFGSSTCLDLFELTKKSTSLYG